MPHSTIAFSSYQSLRDATMEFGARLLRRQTLRDFLTGLPNDALLRDRLGQDIARAQRDNYMIAVLRLDLDRFKELTATLGHLAGDKLLRDVAQRVGADIRATDTFARLGGDEFALVQPQLRCPAEAATLVAKIEKIFQAPFELDGHEVLATPNLGIALFPQDGPDPETLLEHANLALYRAKTHSPHHCVFFEPAMDEEVQARRRLERELQEALKRGEFVLHYQPQLELATGRFTGTEALVRWNHPCRGLVMPGEFIPVAEATGLIRPLGEWVMRTACRQARIWRKNGWNLSVAVNLSPVQLRKGYALPAIGDALSQAGLEPAQLELEITESTLMERIELSGDGFLRDVTADGVRLALDDFGVGYSSLAYLRHLPVQTIKIDRSFVRDLGEAPDAAALVRAIVMLGRSLRMRVVAEGVENATQLALLRDLGCDNAQGFYIARPQAAETLDHLLGTDPTFGLRHTPSLSRSADFSYAS